MSNFKISVIRRDGIQHESTFGGWNAENSTIHYWKKVIENPRTLCAVWFEGVQSPNSSDIQWSPRSSFNVDEG